MEEFYNRWKVPISTYILELTRDNPLLRIIFCEILLQAQHKDYETSFRHGNKVFVTTIKKGEMIFKVKNFRSAIGVGEKSVTKILEILQKWEIIEKIKREPYGLRITINRYDDLIKMEIKGRFKEESKKNQRRIKDDTSKESDKKKESEEKKETFKNPFLNSNPSMVSIMADYVMEIWRETRGSKKMSTSDIANNLAKWLEIYPIEKITLAIIKSKYVKLGNFDPAIVQILRLKNKNGPTDVIAQFLDATIDHVTAVLVKEYYQKFKLLSAKYGFTLGEP